MIKGDSEYLEQISKTHLCAEHGTPVVVAWHSKEGSYVLRCSEGEYPEEVTREPTPTQKYKAGQLPAVGGALDLMPKTDLGNNKELSAQQIVELLRYADRYGLDAHRGHVMLMYGKPYIGIDGYLYYANKEGIRYNLDSRPLSEVERTAYQVPEGSHAWLSKVVKGDQGGMFTGLGIVTKDEMTTKSDRKPDQLRSPVVASHPWQLAQKRAEWQALRRAFPIGKMEKVNNET